MGSLREQLVKAGLVSEKEAKASAHRQRVKEARTRPEARKNQPRGTATEQRPEEEARKARDRKLNEEAKTRQGKKEQAVQETQKGKSVLDRAFREGSLERWGGARTFYFQDGTRIEFLRVTEEAARRLEAGTAAIVRLSPGTAQYTLLAAGPAKEVRAVSPETVVVLNR